MKITIVDTGVWAAYANLRDSLHKRACELLADPDLRLFTTWPIVWETVTLLSRDANPHVAADAGMGFVEGRFAQVVNLTEVDYSLAWSLMRSFANLRLSAADATACALARRIRAEVALSFDRDFEIVLGGNCEIRGQLINK